MKEAMNNHPNKPPTTPNRPVRLEDRHRAVLRSRGPSDVEQVKAELDQNWLAIDVSIREAEPSFKDKLQPKVATAVTFIRNSVEKLLRQAVPFMKRAWRNRTSRIIILCVVGFLIVNIVLWQIGTHNQPANDGQTQTGKPDEAAVPSLSFTPVLPDGDITKTSSGKLSKYPDREGASFTDKIGEVEIIVSQQPLPPEFATDPDGSLHKLAKDSNHNESLDLGGNTAYLGTSIKGPQKVVMRVGQVLIFVSAPQAIDKTAWADYLRTLK